MDGGEKAVVIAAPDRRVEEEMAGFLEAGERLEIGHAALDVGMAGLPIIRLDAIGFQQHGIGHEEAGRFDVDDEGRARVELRQIARQHHADLVGEDLLAAIVDDAAAVAVAIEAEADIGAALAHLVGHRMQHFQVFGIGIVVREVVIELGVERDDFAAELFENRAARRRRPCHCRRRRRP